VKFFLCLTTVLVATAAAMGRPMLEGPEPSRTVRPYERPQPGVRPHPGVVRVIVSDGTGMSFGSGALVAVRQTHGLVVTNWHVVRDAAGPITVVFPDGFRSEATLLRTDRQWDLAALAIRRPPVDPIPVAAQPPRPGEPLTIAGYGGGQYRAVTGRCTQYVAPGPDYPFEMVELSAGAREGDSGGPIFNRRGELAGVLFGAAWGQTTGSYCGRVRWFLSSVDDDFRRLQPDPVMIARRAEPPPSTTPRQPPPRPTVIARPWHPPSGELARQVAPQPEPPGGTWRPADAPGGPADGRPSEGPPLVAIPATPSGVMESGGSPPPAAGSEPDSDGSWVPSERPRSAASPEPTTPLRWEDVAGDTLGEQVKTVLAAIGLLAVFFHGLRLLGKR
jgi:serine protease Do